MIMKQLDTSMQSFIICGLPAVFSFSQKMRLLPGKGWVLLYTSVPGTLTLYVATFSIQKNRTGFKIIYTIYNISKSIEKMIQLNAEGESNVRIARQKKGKQNLKNGRHKKERYKEGM
jgi:hypothetical protein